MSHTYLLGDAFQYVGWEKYWWLQFPKRFMSILEAVHIMLDARRSQRSKRLEKNGVVIKGFELTSKKENVKMTNQMNKLSILSLG